jgi:predicted secreted protein
MHTPKFYEHLVNLDVGSYFYVVLDENLSTGYHWESIDSNL